MSKFHYVTVKVKEVVDGKSLTRTENVLVEGAVSLSDVDKLVSEKIVDIYGMGINFEIKSVQNSQVTLLITQEE